MQSVSSTKVHGPTHDISRWAAFFWVQAKSGRVAATGAAPPCEPCAIARWADHGWHSRTSPAPLRSAFAMGPARSDTQRTKASTDRKRITCLRRSLCHTIGNLWHSKLDRAPRSPNQTLLAFCPIDINNTATKEATSGTKRALAQAQALHMWRKTRKPTRLPTVHMQEELEEE